MTNQFNYSPNKWFLGITIFIIQDNVVYKDLIVGYLKSRKYQNIKTFKSGEDCLPDLHLEPDVIVLDYAYKGMTGLEFMRKIKSKYPQTDFIFLSGQNEVEVAVEIMQAGAADYIVKNNKN